MKIIVVALRHFFAHLKREDIIGHDLSSALDLPRLDRLLPEMLSEAEIEQLLSVELPETPLGLRDRALLEVLYASGLRAGEIVGLRLENYLREERLLRVIGKGNRERVVPVGEKAMAALDRWLARGRPLLVKPKTGGEIFLGEHGRRLTTARVWQIVRDMAKLAGLRKKIWPHLLAPLLRDSLAQPRRRPARDPGNARPRELGDHPSLHARRPGAAQTDPSPVSSARLNRKNMR